MKCRYCGLANEPNQRLCAYCGAPLPQPTRNPASTPVEIMLVKDGTFTLARSKSNTIAVYRICADGAFSWVGSTWNDGLCGAPESVRQRANEMLEETR